MSDWDDVTAWVDSRRSGGGGGPPIARPVAVMMILLACFAAAAHKTNQSQICAALLVGIIFGATDLDGNAVRSACGVLIFRAAWLAIVSFVQPCPFQGFYSVPNRQKVRHSTYVVFCVRRFCLLQGHMMRKRESVQKTTRHFSEGMCGGPARQQLTASIPGHSGYHLGERSQLGVH